LTLTFPRIGRMSWRRFNVGVVLTDQTSPVDGDFGALLVPRESTWEELYGV
jgi:hypothetical protein